MRDLRSVLRVGVFSLGALVACLPIVTPRANPVPPREVPYPTSMAALGDSITQAFDSLGYRGILQAEPQYSWATGYANARLVDSQYLRLLAVDPKIKGHERNYSVTGAKVSGLGAQVAQAVRQRAGYAVILIGANDVCTRTIAGMTPVATFARVFSSDLATLVKGLPKGAHIFVSSIPNLFQLWSIFHTNATAEARWALGICQSMLAASDTSADRAFVLKREEAFNSVLGSTCRHYATCRWDDLAVFHNSFTTAELNTLDYYHPNLLGQNRLAAITWAHSWWSSSK
ncbi:MAG: GDSL-type esterase/lipase family protein [Actinomycetota bacterium]|jgi:lysophospholipase L1-like esterase|nr:GDSL-type esterase/lipase family protein [Actinomycetota bacterium]